MTRTVEQRQKHNEYMRAYYQQTKEKWSARSKTYYEASKSTKGYQERRRRSTLKKYGLTPTEWDVKFYRQGFCCDICGIHDLDFNGRWDTDHCHKSGMLRGILCHPCNVMLGAARDNVANLQRAIGYLENDRH